MPQTPHLIHFSPVKEVVEKESGRFEFFKQMLIVGLGGIAGLAAIFTDADKIPEDLWLKVPLAIFAVCALVVVIASANGISTYANHLRHVKRNADDPTDANLQSAARSESSILNHARCAMAASWVGAAALITFAGIELFQQPMVGADAAMRTARKMVIDQPGNPSLHALDHFQASGNDYLITYVTDPDQVKYTVRINRETNKVLEITRSSERSQ